MKDKKKVTTTITRSIVDYVAPPTTTGQSAPVYEAIVELEVDQRGYLNAIITSIEELSAGPRPLDARTAAAIRMLGDFVRVNKSRLL